MNQIDALLHLVDAYCAATSLAEATVSTRVLRAGGRISSLRGGASDIGVNRCEQAVQWFSDNWPEGTAWPKGVKRPAKTNAAPTAAPSSSENSGS